MNEPILQEKKDEKKENKEEKKDDKEEEDKVVATKLDSDTPSKLMLAYTAQVIGIYKPSLVNLSTATHQTCNSGHAW